MRRQRQTKPPDHGSHHRPPFARPGAQVRRFGGGAWRTVASAATPHPGGRTRPPPGRGWRGGGAADGTAGAPIGRSGSCPSGAGSGSSGRISNAVGGPAHPRPADRQTTADSSGSDRPDRDPPRTQADRRQRQQIARALNVAVLEGRVLQAELTQLEAFAGEIRDQVAGVDETLRLNRAYWDGG